MSSTFCQDSVLLQVAAPRRIPVDQHVKPGRLELSGQLIKNNLAPPGQSIRAAREHQRRH